MINNKTIAVVVSAYNEETQIGMVLESMPEFVDRIIVVNDHSNDLTQEIVRNYILNDPSVKKNIDKVKNHIEPNRYNHADILTQRKHNEEIKSLTPCEVYNENELSDRIILINHKKNAGKGAAIATGFKWARDHHIDCIATMDGDGQMDPEELQSICWPVISEGIDYVKGNRLIHRSASEVIPATRFIGNSILSILTKLASGYWHVSDTQTGFTAISKHALDAIQLHKIYKSYGYPNDLLVKLNIAYCTIKEVEIKPVYNLGEKSKMKIWKVIPRVSWLLLKSFYKRIWIRYFLRDFHPLFLLYNLSFILLFSSIPFLNKILYHSIISNTPANPVTVLAFIFLAISSFQSLLFAMWMDIQDNERLFKN